MTKAETKALEKYPVKHRLNKKATGEFDSNLPRRKAYIEGYHQAIADACEWLKSYRQDTPDGTGYIAGIVNDKTIEDFRSAMEE